MPALPPTRHSLHSAARIWPESNCYLDLWIEATHSWGLDPLPMLVCALGARFEMDQWTFCKPSPSELGALYGLRVEELNIWRDTLSHVQTQVSAGRLVLIEVDAYYLPDTAGLSYRQQHQKTTVGVREVRVDSGELEYFHNSGIFTLSGEDFARIFDGAVTSSMLPAFAELVDPSRLQRLDVLSLARIAERLAAARLVYPVDENPYRKWAAHAESELRDLATNDIGHFHAWAFATVRQAGCMSELSADWCRWLSASRAAEEQAEWRLASEAFLAIAQTLAGQQFRLARLPNGGKHSGFVTALERCGELWESGHRSLQHLLFREPGELPAVRERQ